MLDTAIPRKTLLGQRELVDRRQKLHARSRSLLIAVHGEHSVAELRRQFAALGDVGGILDELSALGLIMADGQPGAAMPTAESGLPPLQMARAFINETAVAVLGLRAFLFTLNSSAATPRPNSATCCPSTAACWPRPRTRSSPRAWQAASSRSSRAHDGV